MCIVACVAYAVNRWGIKPHLGAGIFHDHFNDLWLIPAALPLVLWLQRICRLRTHDAFPTLWEISLHLGLWSVLFEVIGPRVAPVTGDWKDVAAYALGAGVAWIWWSRLATKASTP